MPSFPMTTRSVCIVLVALLASGAATSVAGQASDPPGKDDVHRGLLQGVVEAGGSWHETNENTVRISFLTLLGQIDYDMTVEVRGMRVLDPGPARSHEVEVDFVTQTRPVGEMGQLFGDFAAMLDGLRAAASEPEVLSFELTPEGWTSPTMRDRVTCNAARMANRNHRC